VIDFVQAWSTKTELPVERFIDWLGIARGKFFDWRKRYGKINERNPPRPRVLLLTSDEQAASFDVHERLPLECYRRHSFMVID